MTDTVHAKGQCIVAEQRRAKNVARRLRFIANHIEILHGGKDWADLETADAAMLRRMQDELIAMLRRYEGAR